MCWMEPITKKWIFAWNNWLGKSPASCGFWVAPINFGLAVQHQFKTVHVPISSQLKHGACLGLTISLTVHAVLTAEPSSAGSGLDCMEKSAWSYEIRVFLFMTVAFTFVAWLASLQQPSFVSSQFQVAVRVSSFLAAESWNHGCLVAAWDHFISNGT